MAPTPDAGNLKVAAVVAFYMVSALVVSCRNSPFNCALKFDEYLFLDGFRVRWLPLRLTAPQSDSASVIRQS